MSRAKGALDGMTGALWTDDRQIDALSIVRGEVRKSAPCVVVSVSRLATPGAAGPRATEGSVSALTRAGSRQEGA